MKIILFLLFLPLLLFSNEVEQKFINAGLVDIQTVDPSIQVKLVNSNKRYNIFRENYYKSLQKAYIQQEVAIKLKKAQEILKESHPNYSLCILDAARPRSVSQSMYDKLKNTEFKKFIANPQSGSMHNYGIALDITISDNGDLLDMGPTPFFKSRAKVKALYQQQKKGAKPTTQQQINRTLLSTVMQKAGFLPLNFEWWHFNGLSKEIARQTYKIIE